MTEVPKADRHAVNFFVSTEMKQALEQLSERRGKTLASLIRLALRTALPILNGLWDAEDEILRDWSATDERRRRVRRKEAIAAMNNKDGGPSGKSS